MSHETDRMPVPTNGRNPHPPGTVSAVEAAPTPPTPPAGVVDGSPGVSEPTPAFTPTQLAVGFGIVASLILLLVGRRRRGRRP